MSEPVRYPLTELNPKQQLVMDLIDAAAPGSYSLLGYGGAMGGGKGQCLCSLVYTPFGAIRMGAIRVGSQVSNPEGGVSRVIAVHPLGERDIYRFTFDDGAECEVTEDHLWMVRDVQRPRFRKKTAEERPTQWRIMTALQVREKVDEGARLVIPLTAPVEFTRTARSEDGLWPIDPYVLGVLLGDGSFRTVTTTLASADEEIVERVRAAGYEVVLAGSKGQCSFYRLPGLADAIARLGLGLHYAWDKFVPTQYMEAPLRVRWDILRGLMDTDGYADSRGHCSFTTTSEQLAKDVQWLGRSLGFKANITSKIPTYRYLGEKKEGRLAYTVWLKGNSGEELFWLTRKRERAAAPFNGGDTRSRKIVKVEFSRSAEAQCITVDHPNGLYITDDFIVTHNSHLIVRHAIWQSLKFPGNRGLIARENFNDLQTTTLEEFDRICPPQFISKSYNSSPVYRDIRLAHWPEGVASRVFFRGLNDPANYGSEQYGFIDVDEASGVSKFAATMLLTRLRHQLPKVVNEKLERLGLGMKYVFMAASNPYPGTFFEDWFHKGELDEAREALGDKMNVHFVLSKMEDNNFLPENYLAMNAAALPKNLRERFVEGRWDTFEGQIYETFDQRTHAWKGEVPKDYVRVVGGLDFGGESETAHHTAGIVGVITKDNRLIRVACFHERGPNVVERLMAWMMMQQEKWGKPVGKRIQWKADKTQSVGISFLNKVAWVTPASGKPDSVDMGILMVARRLDVRPDGKPGSFYVPEECSEWAEEMRMYRREPETGKIHKKRDDLVDCDRYMHEAIDTLGGDPQKLMKNALPVVR